MYGSPEAAQAYLQIGSRGEGANIVSLADHGPGLTHLIYNQTVGNAVGQILKSGMPVADQQAAIANLIADLRPALQAGQLAVSNLGSLEANATALNNLVGVLGSSLGRSGVAYEPISAMMEGMKAASAMPDVFASAKAARTAEGGIGLINTAAAVGGVATTLLSTAAEAAPVLKIAGVVGAKLLSWPVAGLIATAQVGYAVYSAPSGSKLNAGLAAGIGQIIPYQPWAQSLANSITGDPASADLAQNNGAGAAGGTGDSWSPGDFTLRGSIGGEGGLTPEQQLAMAMNLGSQADSDSSLLSAAADLVDSNAAFGVGQNGLSTSHGSVWVEDAPQYAPSDNVLSGSPALNAIEAAVQQTDSYNNSDAGWSGASASSASSPQIDTGITANVGFNFDPQGQGMSPQQLWNAIESIPSGIESFANTAVHDVENLFTNPVKTIGGWFKSFFGPVVLDLSGNGINITRLDQSDTFFDTADDGLQHLTSWAGTGNAVLFYDSTGKGQLTRADQFVFTDLDPGATSDMQALEDVFDTDHNGQLTSADAAFDDFFVDVLISAEN